MAKSATLRGAGDLYAGARRRDRVSGGLLLRARTRILRPRLDSLIARGVERRGDRALALREAQLAGERDRRRLAGRIEELLEAPSRRHAFSAAVPIDSRAVKLARPALIELIEMLRSDEAVEPRGVALAWRLLTDACSPVFLPPGRPSVDREALQREARRLVVALRPFGTGLPGDPSLN